MKNKILFITLLAAVNLFAAPVALRAQTPSPSPADSDAGVTVGGYEITSSVELGVRGLSINGSENKYRSDFNYRPGFRIFDSSFVMEDKEGDQGGFFDSLSVTSSGWSADPTGYLRVNMEKLGAYRFDANVRRVHYFNQLENHILGFKGANTKRNFGDFDLTILPQNESLRFRLGASFNDTTGSAGFTTRNSDVFPITKTVDSDSADFRAGVDGKLFGFKLSATGGFRRFNDDTVYRLTEPNLGVNPTDAYTLSALDRNYPIEGDTKYGLFTAQRTFAGRLDVTGRFIYSETDRDFELNEDFSGQGQISRTNTTRIIIDSDLIEAMGEAKRVQSRTDFGITYAVTNKFRLSNSFSFDQFDITGDSDVAETVMSRILSTGVPRPTTFTNTAYWRLHGFKRFVNTFEGDYQFSHRFGINVGYRYTHRKVDIFGFNRPVAPLGEITEFEEEEENSTHAVLIGTRIKPLSNWSIFADLEAGESDNAFTRLSNYNFVNFRFRSNWSYKQFTFNVSAISRDNENPSDTAPVGNVPAGQLVADIKNRVFSAYLDWTPDARLTLSGGYTYHRLTSRTDIVVPLQALTQGFSEFYMRDSYVFFDVSARPFKRVSIYASYRFNEDTGQGDKASTAPQFIVSSYPFRLHMPEVRLAFRLTRNIDWNVGYQYYGYRENLLRAYFDPVPPNQNYTAHMPYTSLRIYFGRKE